jgi:hypothetical protein
MGNGTRNQAALNKRKAELALGEFMENDDETPEDTLPPEQVEQVETQSAAKEKQRVLQREADQIKTMLVFEADRKAAAAAAAAAEAYKVLQKERPAKKTPTGKENETNASVRGQPQPPREETHREPLAEVVRHPPSAATKVVSEDSVRTIVALGDPASSPAPSGTSSITGAKSVLFGRGKAPDLNSALQSNRAREDMAGVANQMVCKGEINPVKPLNEQPRAFGDFRDELCRQFSMFEREDGGKLKDWLRKWLGFQRAQARGRTKRKGGNQVELQPRYQEELALYRAEKGPTKIPVARLLIGAPESTGNGEPSRVAVEQPTGDAPETEEHSMRIDQFIPCVLTEEQVDHMSAGDYCILARRELVDDGKCKETFKNAIAAVAVRSSSLTRNYKPDTRKQQPPSENNLFATNTNYGHA